MNKKGRFLFTSWGKCTAPQKLDTKTFGMKKYYYQEKMAAIELLKEGKSRHAVSRISGIDYQILTLLWHKYQSGGHMALMDTPGHSGYDEAIKSAVVRDYLEKGVSLTTVALQYNIPHGTIMRWSRRYMKSGEEGLKDKRKALNKKRERTQKELDELEMLRRRNEYLEAENALLKKVKALVEEREARLRAIGRKPSKD